jgi:hypothetical protein
VNTASIPESLTPKQESAGIWEPFRVLMQQKSTKRRYRHLSTENKWFMNKEIKWWQVALATVIVSVLGALSTGSSKKNQRKFEQAPWAPPAKLFGPAWAINNYFLLQALKNYCKARTSATERNC